MESTHNDINENEISFKIVHHNPPGEKITFDINPEDRILSEKIKSLFPIEINRIISSLNSSPASKNIALEDRLPIAIGTALQKMAREKTIINSEEFNQFIVIIDLLNDELLHQQEKKKSCSAIHIEFLKNILLILHYYIEKNDNSIVCEKLIKFCILFQKKRFCETSKNEIYTITTLIENFYIKRLNILNKGNLQRKVMMFVLEKTENPTSALGLSEKEINQKKEDYASRDIQEFLDLSRLAEIIEKEIIPTDDEKNSAPYLLIATYEEMLSLTVILENLDDFKETIDYLLKISLSDDWVQFIASITKKDEINSLKTTILINTDTMNNIINKIIKQINELNKKNEFEKSKSYIRCVKSLLSTNEKFSEKLHPPKKKIKNFSGSTIKLPLLSTKLSPLETIEQSTLKLEKESYIAQYNKFVSESEKNNLKNFFKSKLQEGNKKNPEDKFIAIIFNNSEIAEFFHNDFKNKYALDYTLKKPIVLLKEILFIDVNQFFEDVQFFITNKNINLSNLAINPFKKLNNEPNNETIFYSDNLIPKQSKVKRKPIKKQNKSSNKWIDPRPQKNSTKELPLLPINNDGFESNNNALEAVEKNVKNINLSEEKESIDNLKTNPNSHIPQTIKIIINDTNPEKKHPRKKNFQK